MGNLNQTIIMEKKEVKKPRKKVHKPLKAEALKRRKKTFFYALLFFGLGGLLAAFGKPLGWIVLVPSFLVMFAITRKQKSQTGKYLTITYTEFLEMLLYYYMLKKTADGYEKSIDDDSTGDDE